MKGIFKELGSQDNYQLSFIPWLPISGPRLATHPQLECTNCTVVTGLVRIR